MHFLELLAHGEELHSETTTETGHTLTQPIVALPLFIGILIAIYLLLTKGMPKLGFKASPTTVLLVFMGLFLVLGIAFYSLVPAISVISLTAGIGLSLFFTLLGIAK